MNDPSCLSSLGTLVDPWAVFGDFEGTNFDQAKALIITYLISNDDETTAEIWEQKFLDIAQRNYAELTLYVSAQSSMKLEITKVSGTDHFTVVLSFVVMYIYISFFALAKLFPVKSKFVIVDSKMSLGTHIYN